MASMTEMQNTEDTTKMSRRKVGLQTATSSTAFPFLFFHLSGACFMNALAMFLKLLLSRSRCLNLIAFLMTAATMES